MTRLFSAFTLPEDVADHLATHLAEYLPDLLPALRPTPREQWHVTVGFYGEDDVGRRSALLHERVKNLTAPRLRLAGSGTFDRVALLLVRTRGPALDAVAGAADAAAGGHGDYLPHVTVARWSAPTDAGERLAARLRDYRGPAWTPGALALFRVDRGRAGSTYTAVDRVGLRSTGPAEPTC